MSSGKTVTMELHLKKNIFKSQAQLNKTKTTFAISLRLI